MLLAATFLRASWTRHGPQQAEGDRAVALGSPSEMRSEGVRYRP
jgi:hypothetical protein